MISALSFQSACRRLVYKSFAEHPLSHSTRLLSSTALTLAQATKAKKAVKKPSSTRRKKVVKSVYDSEKMPLEDAIHVLRSVEVASPNSMYELTVKTGMPRGATIPKGRIAFPREPKQMERDRILVFAEGRSAEDARQAGADYVGGLELVEPVATGRIQASIFLCTPALIRGITPRLGRILGPRGLMPSERRGTVLEDVARYIRRLQGSSEWRSDKAGTIRTPIGKMTFPIGDVVRNIDHFMAGVKAATGNVRTGERKDANKIPNPINKVILSSTQGPGIQISNLI